MSAIDTASVASTARAGTQIHLAYPTMRRAAQILGVNVSALSRRRPEAVEVGAQRRLPARVVMAEAVYYNRRDLLEVAGELEEVAEEQAPDARVAVEEEVSAFMRERRAARAPEPADDDWLEEARRYLPAALFERVRDVYARVDGPGQLSGPAPN